MSIENASSKKSFWLRIAEANLLPMLDEMGYNEQWLLKWQKKRFMKAMIMLVLGTLIGSIINTWIMLMGPLLALFVWMIEYRRVTMFYKKFQFDKQLQFNKFTRMLIPLLLEKSATLYSALNKMLKRMDEGHVKSALERLLIGLNDQPNSEEPFRKFAKDASGTDQAMLFMTTLYDYQQSSFDTSIINELGQMSSQQLFEGVRDIVEFKLRKFYMFPTKLTMASFLPIAGYAAAMIIDTISKLSL
ncbi:hypothetical protein [Bacillus paralicheniformis]|uniref:hypothetical protein n=1 Tax=Bacillus paralicheniformis TaxID=1648923 RepID=UPI00227EF2AE|nr:hypothetical protein [Bacillus paralicheniformis]MCY8151330.1 hypothetical protein [Bacillus paralicheniformis]MEC1053180.1 hypothetical protein [Bacillus paralicheniformis]MEC1087750.1 hypothetical protein [Bacillus paralicheniformis]MEC1108819.1 hypothetical protein [Bacillus paralicheniformis]MEC1141080.1 hypothetical protein [Bacillus paralicheniformis]